MSEAADELSPPSYEELRAANQELAGENTKLEQELELVKFQLNKLKADVYGRRSEKQYAESPEQERLFDLGESNEPSLEEEWTDVKAHKKKRRSKKVIPQDLPVDEVVYEPTETHCSECDTELKEVSRDVRREVEYVPARFYVKEHVSVHCACPKCETMYSGEAPPESKPVIPGTQIGPGFFAYIIVSKFCDHIPYYRQSQIYEREGLYLPDKSLSRYGLTLGGLLEPVAKAIKAELIARSYLQADETRLKVLEDIKNHTSHTGQLWVLNDPLDSLTYYEYHEGRGKDAASALLSTFEGALQTDAYASYNGHNGIRLGCLSHARRYFVKAKPLAPKECGHVVALIGKLYKIERELKKLRTKCKKLEEWYEKRLQVREQSSAALLTELKQYLLDMKERWLLEEHPVYTAINYMLNRFDSFRVYTTNGRFEIDNNDIERMIRPIAVGRRNWLFAGSHHGARMAAVMMTIVGTCKQRKINPQHYLTHVLPRLANHNTTSLTGLTPLDWNPD